MTSLSVEEWLGPRLIAHEPERPSHGRHDAEVVRSGCEGDSQVSHRTSGIASVEREQAPHLREAWVTGRLARKQAVGPLDVTRFKGQECATGACLVVGAGKEFKDRRSLFNLTEIM